jgi:hypothetical protein
MVMLPSVARHYRSMVYHFVEYVAWIFKTNSKQAGFGGRQAILAPICFLCQTGVSWRRGGGA